MSYIIIPKAKIIHYIYNGEEKYPPKITEYEGKKYASFTIEEKIAVWNKKEQNNEFKNRQWKCKLSGYVAEQFEREYNMDPNTQTEIVITMSKLKNTEEGKIPVGEYKYSAFADVIEVQSFSLKNITKNKNQSENVESQVESEPQGIEGMDIPF